MKKYRTATYQYNNRQAFWSVVALVAVLFGAYIYFVSAAVAHVVVRKELEEKIADVQTTLSELETDYILAKDKVAEDMAYARGFKKTEEKIFVVKKTDSVALSPNTP